jgi:AcrR family transcriptional regulator
MGVIPAMVTAKRRTTPLTTDELFERALHIADKDGLEALTMRRLAADVGVEAASLYHHIPNKEALLDGVVVRMRSEIHLPDPIPEDWRDLMVAIWSEYARLLAAHPNLVSLAGRRVETDPDSGLVFLTQLGFSDAVAVELWQSMMACTLGFAMFRSAYTESDTSDLPDGLAATMANWRDETCTKTLRMIVDAYDTSRADDSSHQAK